MIDFALPIFVSFFLSFFRFYDAREFCVRDYIALDDLQKVISRK